MKASTLKLIIAWMLVILPLGWGVYKSAVKSKPLFQSTPAVSKP
ncbi:MAG: hypothetical protein RL088_1341 [Verrucomicrobiota bacterium]|jgi:hypothetical protein